MKIYQLALICSLVLFSNSACKKRKVEKAATKMQEFIIEISKSARSTDPNFIIIPQNGPELLFNNGKEEDGLNTNLIPYVNAFGMEELFYDGGEVTDNYRYDLIKRSGVKVLVADYHSNNTNIVNSYTKSNEENWIAFPRSPDNYDYKNIPTTIYNVNGSNITNLDQAKNYLYLISTDNFLTKSSYLNSLDATNYDVLIIDAFYGDSLLTLSEVNSLKTKANGGHRLVIAYMNIGSAEKFRYYWESEWKRGRPDWLKKKYDGYDDEIWVEYWHPTWKNIIYGYSDSYTKKLLQSGFDGAYLDNVEAFYFLYHRK